MHNIIFPRKDCTIYSKYPEINTGLDEILEITKEISSSKYFFRGNWKANTYYKRYDYVSGSNGYFYAIADNVNETTSSQYWQPVNINMSYNSRILIDFDILSLNSASYNSASKAYLNLYTSVARKISSDYIIESYPVSETWDMGIGNFTEKKERSGATWNHNYNNSEWTSSGGTYISNISASQEFNFAPTDIRMDITDIFKAWKSGSILNNGIIIKRPDIQENDMIDYGSLSFYSMDTHTVYVPTLEVVYDDHIYNTSSFYPSNPSGSISGSLMTGSMNIHIKNLRNNYKYDSIVKFEIVIKDLYQIKTFYEYHIPSEIKYVYDSLYYSIRDAYSNRIIIPFSEYTKVSVDSTGCYFNICLSGFMPERFYKIIFKYVNNGTEQFFDNDNQFKLVK